MGARHRQDATGPCRGRRGRRAVLFDERGGVIHESHADAIRLLRQHRSALDTLVKALLERETLGELEISETIGLPPAPALQNMPLEQSNEGG